jgi:hypothetical protein
MGKLTPEQKRQRDELNALADAPDEDDSDEISWYERTKDGERGATMRTSRARTHGPDWLKERLADKDDAADDADAPAGKDAPPDDGKAVRFGRRVS